MTEIIYFVWRLTFLILFCLFVKVVKRKIDTNLDLKVLFRVFLINIFRYMNDNFGQQIL